MDAEHRKAHARKLAKSKRATGQVLEQARKLARSGQYPDWAGVVAVLEPVEGFETARRRFEEAAFRSQLNLLCTMAQPSGGSRSSSSHATS